MLDYRNDCSQKYIFGVELMRKMVTELPVKSFWLDRCCVWALKILNELNIQMGILLPCNKNMGT